MRLFERLCIQIVKSAMNFENLIEILIIKYNVMFLRHFHLKLKKKFLISF